LSGGRSVEFAAIEVLALSGMAASSRAAKVAKWNLPRTRRANGVAHPRLF
jgi:hypothetical protein